MKRRTTKVATEIFLSDMCGSSLLAELDQPNRYPVIGGLIRKATGVQLVIDVARVNQGDKDEEFFALKILGHVQDVLEREQANDEKEQSDKRRKKKRTSTLRSTIPPLSDHFNEGRSMSVGFRRTRGICAGAAFQSLAVLPGAISQTPLLRIECRRRLCLPTRASLLRTGAFTRRTARHHGTVPVALFTVHTVLVRPQESGELQRSLTALPGGVNCKTSVSHLVPVRPAHAPPTAARKSRWHPQPRSAALRCATPDLEPSIRKTVRTSTDCREVQPRLPGDTARRRPAIRDASGRQSCCR